MIRRAEPEMPNAVRSFNISLFIRINDEGNIFKLIIKYFELKLINDEHIMFLNSLIVKSFKTQAK